MQPMPHEIQIMKETKVAQLQNRNTYTPPPPPFQEVKYKYYPKIYKN